VIGPEHQPPAQVGTSRRRQMIKPIAIALTGLAVFAGSVLGADRYKIDASHSQAVFRITHLNVGAFWGRINDPAGALVVDGDNLSVDVTLTAAKIDTDNEKRDEHLRGADFFNAEQFPILTFKSTSSKKVDGGFEVTGDLTVKGISKPLTLKLNKIGEGKDPWGGTRIGFEGEFILDRLAYGIDYNPNALGKDVRIIVALEGIKE
jgi:polyisoprenoid-binding protein YceI